VNPKRFFPLKDCWVGKSMSSECYNRSSQWEANVAAVSPGALANLTLLGVGTAHVMCCSVVEFIKSCAVVDLLCMEPGHFELVIIYLV
jgi:hypothetical protein